MHVYVRCEHIHDVYVILQSQDRERLITKITKIIFQYWLGLAGSDTWAYIESCSIVSETNDPLNHHLFLLECFFQNTRTL